MNNKNAFTLAEVLITLGIIGVVAAITIPTLINNYKKMHYVNKFKHTYSLLQQAIGMSQVENGPLDTWDYSENPEEEENLTKFAEKYITPYLKIAKNCGTRTGEGCLPEKVMLLNGNEWPYGGTDNDISYKVVLSNGVPITIDYKQNCTENKTYCIGITAHTDGLKKQTTMGRDYFLFDAFPGLNQIYPRGIYPNSTGSYSYLNTDENGNWIKRTKEEIEAKCCNSSQCNGGDWCGGRILFDGYKMNY